MSPLVPVDRWSTAWPAVAVATCLAVALQLWGLYSPQPPTDAGSDKVLHGVGFGLPVVLVVLADTLRRRSRGLRPRARVLVVAIWVSAAHAVLSELIQGAFYAHRSGDPLDLLADWSGIAIAAMFTALGIGIRRAGSAGSTEMPGHGVRDGG
jgi:hypothetical protein